MKILRLKIENFRGIKDLELAPEGENFVIWGPNGSGKSAVVDALDFLLTGRISRLRGEGTGGITLNNHGPHIDSNPEDTLVSAVLSIPSIDEPVQISRSISNPADLNCPEEYIPAIAPILDVANRDQHILSRRQILEFVTSDRSSRGDLVNKLLNTKDLENIRRSFVSATGILERELENATSSVNATAGPVMSITKLDSIDKKAILDLVNQNRAILGGDPLQELLSKHLKQGISAPKILTKGEGHSESPTNLTTLANHIEELLNLQKKGGASNLETLDSNLRKQIDSIKNDKELHHALLHQKLIRMGIDLLDDSGRCPLCLIEWEPDQLEKHLNSRLSQAEKAKEIFDAISETSGAMIRLVSSAQASISTLKTASEHLQNEEYVELLDDWKERLVLQNQVLRSPVDDYFNPPFTHDEVSSYCSPTEINMLLDELDKFFTENIPDSSPEQDSWDLINRLEPALEAYETQIAVMEEADSRAKWAATARDAFIQSRDNVLENIYNTVNQRFSELYRRLHQEDEDTFTSSIKSEGAGVDFKVDFYGRGENPPHALHSEGHQDSMGLCLFLSLSELLSGNDFKLVILDDVVMSVDRDHRRYVSSLFNEYYSERQFLITTHEQSWAYQLRTDQVVTSSGMYGLFNWNVDTGPKILHGDVDPWDRIERDLEIGDVPTASARLRRSSEQFFGLVCDSLDAPVPFRLSSRYHLGELATAARTRLKELKIKATKSAISWGNPDAEQQVLAHYESAKEAFQKSSFEQWKINPTAHFNEWAELSPGEFASAVAAFKELFDAFRCSECGSRLFIVKEGINDVELRCDCQQTTWNLKEKE